MGQVIVKGRQEFLGIEIPVVEGGFGEDKRCILARDVAKLHSVEVKRINEVLRNNIDEFESGVDIIDVKSDVNNDPLFELGFTKEDIRKANNIYLLSESGYMTLCMLLRTKVAKEKRQQFKREYFAMREVVNSDENIKKDLLYKLYTGGVDSIEAHKRLVALETKPLIEKIEADAPKIDRFNKLMNTDHTYTPTQMAKCYGVSSAIKLNKMMNEAGICYKKGSSWLPYANIDNEWYKVSVNEYGTQMKFTGKGVVEVSKILDLPINENELIDKAA